MTAPRGTQTQDLVFSLLVYVPIPHDNCSDSNSDALTCHHASPSCLNNIILHTASILSYVRPTQKSKVHVSYSFLRKTTNSAGPCRSWVDASALPLPTAPGSSAHFLAGGLHFTPAELMVLVATKDNCQVECFATPPASNFPVN